jgi:hypothetical protein
MKTTSALKEAARRLLGSEPRTRSCSVEGCKQQRLIAVAGDASGTTLMCVSHALAWNNSGLCRDVAQHNSGASLTAMSQWIGASHAGA